MSSGSMIWCNHPAVPPATKTASSLIVPVPKDSPHVTQLWKDCLGLDLPHVAIKPKSIISKHFPMILFAFFSLNFHSALFLPFPLCKWTWVVQLPTTKLKQNSGAKRISFPKLGTSFRVSHCPSLCLNFSPWPASWLAPLHHQSASQTCDCLVSCCEESVGLPAAKCALVLALGAARPKPIHFRFISWLQLYHISLLLATPLIFSQGLLASGLFRLIIFSPWEHVAQWQLSSLGEWVWIEAGEI